MHTYHKVSVYHEVPSEYVNSLLNQGIIRTEKGAKGDDEWIIATDKFLDSQRPLDLITAGISRQNNIYGYIFHNGSILSITTGKYIPLNDFISQSYQAILELRVPEYNCYVSNLDLFDVVKEGISNSLDSTKLDELARQYWQSVRPLRDYDLDSPKRIEVMVTENIPPSDLVLIYKAK